MWRELTVDDIKGHLDEDEISVFGEGKDFDNAPLAQELANTVRTVRGFCESGEKCVMPDDERLIPDILRTAALDFCVFNLLKRMRMKVHDPRVKAYDHAQALFEKVATGQVKPENYGKLPSENTPVASTPVPVIRKRKRVLGRREEDGI